jgi:hypothetical protein
MFFSQREQIEPPCPTTGLPQRTQRPAYIGRF